MTSLHFEWRTATDELYEAGAASPLSELVAWLLYEAGADPLMCLRRSLLAFQTVDPQIVFEVAVTAGKFCLP